MNQDVQDGKRERLTQVVAAASLVVSFAYIVWRWGWTLDTEALWFSVPVVVAESYGLLTAALLTYTTWTLRRREAPPALPDRLVDVFLTVADEPLAVIRKTALAAREIRYPHTTWLLDDGHRDELRTVATEMGIRYLRRDDATHGKAGNLNHALAHATGEFILQLDADHVPLPQIVDRLIGFFDDERVAVAQSPQDFYNTDAFSDDASGRRRQLWGDQQLFFNVLQPGKDRIGAAIFVGSCAMVRRAAIDDVGGFATGTATVGTETSILLHARGWRTAYLNENLAFGLAPSTAYAYHAQQLHRAQGGMQLLRRLPPLATPGLTLAQRLAYLDTLTTPLGSLQRLVIYLAPIVFLTTGVFPIHSSVGAFAAFFIPAMLLRAVSFRLLTRGHGSLLLTDRYWMAKFFPHLISVRAFFTPGRLRFRPRPDEAGTVPLRTVAPQLTLIGLTLLALAWATWARTLGYGAEVPGWGLLALFAAVGLALWHAGLAAHVVQLSLAGRHRRAEHRFAESLAVALRVIRPDGKLSSTDIAMTDDLTATGLALRCMYPIPEGARVELTLPLSGGEVQVRGHVVRHATSETELGTVHLAGVEFDGTSRETRDAIELHCAQHAMPLGQQRQRQGALGAGAMRRLRELRGERRIEVGMPARVTLGEGDAAAEIGVGLLEDVSPRGGRVLLDQPVAEGSTLTLDIPGSTVRASGRVVFVHALETGLGMRFVAGFETDAPTVAAGHPGSGERPAPAWFAAVLRLASRAASSAATGSAAAAGAVARGSRAAAGHARTGTAALARTSRTAAGTLAAGSKSAAARLSSASREAADRVAARSRVAAERAAETAKASRAILEVVREGTAIAAAAAVELASEVRPGRVRTGEVPAAPAPTSPEPEALLPAARAEAVLAADAPAMEPVPVAVPESDPERVVEMEIDGDFSFPFELAVGATLLITETGRVSADIAAVHAIVLGRYTGTLRATRSIRVGPAAHVEGVLDAPEVEIATGAVVNALAAADEEPAGDPAEAPDLGPSTAEPSDGLVPVTVPPDDVTMSSSSSTGETSSEGTPDVIVPDAVPSRPAAPVEPATGAEPAAAETAGAEEEIFVASPIYAEGVSRE